MYEVGDRVKVLSLTHEDIDTPLKIGEIYEVQIVDPDNDVFIRLRDGQDYILYSNQVEKVKED